MSCSHIDAVRDARSFKAHQGAPRGLTSWRTTLTVEGFEQCELQETSGVPEGMWASKALNCVTDLYDMNSAADRARTVIDSLVVGCALVEPQVFGGDPENPADYMVASPAQGVFLTTQAQSTEARAVSWRQHFKPGLRETASPEITLTFRIFVGGQR